MFLYVHRGFLWGEPHCVYDCCFYKLTDEEIAKLPAPDQFTGHLEMCEDVNGVPESLQVEFPTTNVGTRLHLGRCPGVTLYNLGEATAAKRAVCTNIIMIMFYCER
jgi:hypothetical protein